ncbi:restriction endonuclease subunit S [Qipengyuania sp. 483]
MSSFSEQVPIAESGIWDTVPLSSVCRLINGRAYKKSELLDDGPYRVLRVGNFFTNKNWYYSDLELDADKYCDNGDLLYAWSASFGPRIWDGEKVIYHYHIWKVEPDTRQIERDYLFYFFEWDKELIREEQGAGATMIHVSKGSMEARSIPLPPLEEQKRIVAVLDQAFAALDRACANAEANLADAEELFGGAVDAVIHRLANGREESLRLGSIVTRLTNGYVGPTRDIYIDDGVPYLLARHVRDNHLRFDGKTYVSDDFNEKNKKSKLKVDDVLLVQSGHIGHSAVVPSDHDGHNCHAMIVLTTIKETLSGEYLSAVFNTPGMQKRFQDIRTGSTVPHLTCKMVKELMISVPPLPVQGEVLSEIRRLKLQSAKLKKEYESEISDLDDLRQSILQKAFAGKLA